MKYKLPNITKNMITEHGISDIEYKTILKILDREPNYVELGIFFCYVE